MDSMDDNDVPEQEKSENSEGTDQSSTDLSEGTDLSPDTNLSPDTKPSASDDPVVQVPGEPVSPDVSASQVSSVASQVSSVASQASSVASQASSVASQASSVASQAVAPDESLAADVPPEKAEGMRWYIVQAYSGFEGKAKQALEDRIRTHQMDRLFGRIEVPQETVVEMVKGQKKTGTRKLFPGYVFVEMLFNEDTWHFVRQTPKVTGFLGGDQADPAPLTEAEVERMLSQLKEGTAPTRSKVNFEKGDVVKIKDGPFTDFSGTVEQVNPTKGKLTVSISIFNRATPVELDFVQVERA